MIKNLSYPGLPVCCWCSRCSRRCCCSHCSCRCCCSRCCHCRHCCWCSRCSRCCWCSHCSCRYCCSRCFCCRSCGWCSRCSRCCWCSLTFIMVRSSLLEQLSPPLQLLTSMRVHSLLLVQSLLQVQPLTSHAGIFFADNKGQKSFDQNQWLAIKAWTAISNGREIMKKEAEVMYKFIREVTDSDYRTPKFWSREPDYKR